MSDEFGDNDSSTGYSVGYRKPPRQRQFVKGQSGCLGGRGGNKRASAQLATIGSNTADIAAELRETIPQKDGTQITKISAALKLLFQSAAAGSVPAQRFLVELGVSMDDRSSDQTEALLRLRLRRDALADEFHTARRAGLAPPDVCPHPEHVMIMGDQLIIHGPCDREARAAWELLKHQLQQCVVVISSLKQQRETEPSEVVITALLQVEKMRRKLMRLVPKGWNWRERIYTIGSSQPEVLAYARLNQADTF